LSRGGQLLASLFKDIGMDKKSKKPKNAEDESLPEDHLPGDKSFTNLETDEDLQASDTDDDEDEGVGDGNMGRTSSDPFGK
jgi:hypothetical protein